MSSLLGHSIIGISVSRLSDERTHSLKWTLWILLVAIFPDINYIALWILGTQTVFEYSHSVGFVIILPVLIILYLKYKQEQYLAGKALQLFMASFSHLLLDLLVGVLPKAYLWPFYKEKFTLPFGILPSAGKLDWDNYYLYRNLFIEFGILVPFILIMYIINKRSQIRYFYLTLLLIVHIWIPFLFWGMGLYRG